MEINPNKCLKLIALILSILLAFPTVTSVAVSIPVDTDSVETVAADDGIARLSTEPVGNTYGTDASGKLIDMEDLSSAYVTKHIKTSGNGSILDKQVPGTWVNYLNTIWQNIVGATTDGSDWVSHARWYDTSTMIANKKVEQWKGTGSDGEFEYPSTTSGEIYDQTTNTWHIWAGEHLLYALQNYTEGATILLCKDIDLNGQYYCWPDITLTNSLNIDGDGHTIYNLGAFIEYDETDSSTYDGVKSYNARSGFISFSNQWNKGASYTVKDINFNSGKLYADTSGTTGMETSHLSMFGVETDRVEVSFDDIQIDNYLVCSNSDAVSVFLSIGRATAYDDTTKETTAYDNASYDPYGEGDKVDSYAKMKDYDFKIDANNCSVTNSYVYGKNHVGAMGTFTAMKFTNCYAAGNVLVGIGYHSGAFVSCLNNAGYFENCFSADNRLYSAIQSGGFVGYSGDSVDYVNCYASGIVEGYTNIGGFVGATRVGHDYIKAGYDENNNPSYAYRSRNYSTFTNCYSTTLVGMRTETKESGGFVGTVAYMAEYNPVHASVFNSCYAAGEVGSTQTVNATNENRVGGFVGYDQTYDSTINSADKYKTNYTNCYYDKQTTAMREWVSGRNNSMHTDNTYNLEITGVLTSDSDKYGTGLTSKPAIAHTDVEAQNPELGFIGFGKNSDWVYTIPEHYPALSVFAEASVKTWANPDLVKAYSLASTATVMLDVWDYGYTWDDEGIRSEAKELYDGIDVSFEDHVADRYTYDTVREVVSDAVITDNATFEQMISGGVKTRSYMFGDQYTDIEYDENKSIQNKDELVASNYNGERAFDLDNEKDSLTVTAPGIDWYEVETVENAEIGTRPIRLISFMKVDAGADKTFRADTLYDHKDDAFFTMIDTIKQNMIVQLDGEKSWSTSVMQSYPQEEAFHQVETLNTNFTLADSAWINTEIWRATPVIMGVTTKDFTEVDSRNRIYAYTNEGVIYYFEISQDGIFYQLPDWTADADLDKTRRIELYQSTPDGEGVFDLYSANYSVKVNGTEAGDAANVTQAKWNGRIPLYPDLGETQDYIIRYYWVLGNGRYRSDYKIIEITEDEIDKQQDHHVTIRVYNDQDHTENKTALAVYADGYGTGEDSYSTPRFAKDPAASSSTKDTGNASVTYGENSYVSWSKRNEATVITKTVLTMTSNAVIDEANFVIGQVETSGEIKVGDTIKIPIKTYYLDYEYDTDGTTIIGQITKCREDKVRYTVKEGESGLYLEFDQVIKTSGNDDTLIFDDTAYNITFDLYVQEGAMITVEKVISNYNGEVKDGMDQQVFIINLTEGVDAQIPLNHDTRSKPIYVNVPETITFYVDETVPMEFQLEDISYTVNDKEKKAYTTDGITVNQGDKIEILVTNQFVETGYFKARDTINNLFRAHVPSNERS